MHSTLLRARLACVRRTWTPGQRLHPGDVAWAAAGGTGSPAPGLSLAWGDPLIGFADVWPAAAPDQPAGALLHLAPDATAAERAAALHELVGVAPRLTVEVSTGDPVLREALARHGFRPVGGPWFTQLWRSLGELPDRPRPAGYTIRAVRPGELAARVEVHRRCWAPARIRTLLGLPVTGTEPGSRYSPAVHRAVLAAPDYRPEMDLVAVTPDGTFAAFGLGWLDPSSGAVLFEPVGTDPGHAGRGLGRAVCAELLRVARDLGATQAVVGPRGDDGYPVPRRLYAGLGMREVARFVPLTSVDI